MKQDFDWASPPVGIRQMSPQYPGAGQASIPLDRLEGRKGEGPRVLLRVRHEVPPPPG